MFFHIDETGNSGNNLFDQNQPVLSYGVISSSLNVDVLGLEQHRRILHALGTESLHANEVGCRGLAQIASNLNELQRRFDFRFDYYFIHKPSFAVVTLFNAVFDAGINEAMKWDWYWTPLRFLLLAALDYVLDEALLRESWRLCLIGHAHKEREAGNISAMLAEILKRVDSSDIDKRMKEVISDALRFGIARPAEMDFGIFDQTALAPNSIGFQFVVGAIAHRQKKADRKALGITVDRQSQFNPAQQRTFHFHSKIAAYFKGKEGERDRYLRHPFFEGAREGAMSMMTHFPERQLHVSESGKSIGLQLADTYLWLTSRVINGKEVPDELSPILQAIFSKGQLDGISLQAMMRRWTEFEKKLPPFTALTPQQHSLAAEMVDAYRQKVKSLKL
ncbi:MAG: DUF3800 domain-containing protein [Gammaproteobacteria bacterium]|nr:DUF3800 domain-containing protein [Gammaproteobacteria bacterium]